MADQLAPGPGRAGNREIARAAREGTNSVRVGMAFAAATRAGGQHLPHRAALETAFGRDLSHVRVHSADQGRGVSALGATAAAHGSHIAFQSPHPSLADTAHEVVHVLQSRGPHAEPQRVSAATGPPEREAVGLADRVASGNYRQPLTVGESLPAGVLGRIPGAVSTPAFPPDLPPPTSIAPVDDRFDSEGNLVLDAGGGKWYLGSDPALDFAIGAGYRPELLPLNPNTSFAALKARCDALEVEHQATAEGLKGDGKYWFARVYHFVTHYTLRDIEAGVYSYPHMKMQQIVHFHGTYASNLAAWTAGDLANVEANWREAFSQAEDSGSILGASKSAGNALLPSIEAHVRLDLPRAIAAAYDLHYAGIPGASLNSFRADFFAMSSVFERATDAVNPEIDDEGTDIWPGNWQWVGTGVFPFLFSMNLERNMAWEKALIISESREAGLAATSRQLKASMGAMHPNLEPFDVGGETIGDYDWLTQPGAQPDALQPDPTHEVAPVPPPLPDYLYFKLDRPTGTEDLEHAVRSDQDLEPLLEFARWTRLVRGAVVLLRGQASSDGSEVLNENLAQSRSHLLEFFLWRASADLENNTILHLSSGEHGAAATRDWRYVAITIIWKGASRQQVWTPASRLPSEART